MGYDEQVELESAVLNAFSKMVKPSASWVARTRLEYEVQELLKQRSWLEAVGMTLRVGDLDCSLAIWEKFLPHSVMAYFLPSHLLLSSIALGFDSDSDYPRDVMEALLLPDPDQAVTTELEVGLSASALTSQFPERAVHLYNVLSNGQRACVSMFLEFYSANRGMRWSTRTRALYLQNSELWAKSTYG